MLLIYSRKKTSKNSSSEKEVEEAIQGARRQLEQTKWGISECVRQLKECTHNTKEDWRKEKERMIEVMGHWEGIYNEAPLVEVIQGMDVFNDQKKALAEFIATAQEMERKQIKKQIEYDKEFDKILMSINQFMDTVRQTRENADTLSEMSTQQIRGTLNFNWSLTLNLPQPVQWDREFWERTLDQLMDMKREIMDVRKEFTHVNTCIYISSETPDDVNSSPQAWIFRLRRIKPMGEAEEGRAWVCLMKRE